MGRIRWTAPVSRTASLVALVLLAGCGGYRQLGASGDADDAGEGTGESGGGEASGGEGTDESGTPPDLADDGGTVEECLPASAGYGAAGGHEIAFDAAISKATGQAYVLTRGSDFAEVVSAPAFADYSGVSAKLAVLEGWDLYPAGIDTGSDGSVYVGATLQRNEPNGFESIQWATRMTRDLEPIWRSKIYPYGTEESAWADQVVVVDDHLWLIGAVEDADQVSHTTVTILDAEGEVIDTREIDFPASAHKVGTTAHARWLGDDEVVIGGSMLASNDGQGWEDGWIVSLSADASVNWLVTPAPIIGALTGTSDRLWAVEDDILHELDRDGGSIAQHALPGLGVDVDVFENHLVVGTRDQSESTIHCLDFDGELTGSEPAIGQLNTVLTWPNHVLMAGAYDGAYEALLVHD